MKSIITFVLSIISIFVIFLVFECIRLYAVYGSSPLFIKNKYVIMNTKNDERIDKIESLGFSVENKLEKISSDYDKKVYTVNSKKYKLFDKYEIWSITR